MTCDEYAAIGQVTYALINGAVLLCIVTSICFLAYGLYRVAEWIGKQP